ncbi:MAG TPA: F0F1 ATP synthase subunit gamma [Pseudomonadota bacterium]|nr:F0F1 ATP synthase subunit gamma [Pseudomonadota bacterium]
MFGADLAARIRTVQQLGDLTQAMRQLAAARQRQAAENFAGLERYAAATLSALQRGLALLSKQQSAPKQSGTSQRLLVVCLSEHGFVGALNETLVSKVVHVMAEAPSQLFVLGKRGLRHVEERGLSAHETASMPTTLGSVSRTASDLVERLFDRVSSGEVAEIEVVFARLRGSVSYEPICQRLFPPHVLPAAYDGEPPLHTLPVEKLTARLLEEYVFAQVTWMIASAFACEQAARFSAMDASHRNLQEQLGELRQQERAERQDSITSEILEVATASSLLAESHHDK